MDYLTNDTELTAVADAIREKCESTDLLEWPEGFIQAIEDCQTGGPELEWLWGNQITNTMSGTIDSTDDAYAAPMLNLNVDGVSTQVTYSGKNLFDKDNAPLGYYDNSGEFHTSGSGTSGYSWWSVPVSEGDVIRWANSTNNFLTGWSGDTFVQLAETRPTSPYTIPSWIDEVRGYTQNSTLDTCIVTKNNADLTYEPYTGGIPSPNPSYPQEIESVDALTLHVAGRNLWGGEKLKADVLANTSGSTTGEDENGSYVQFYLSGNTGNAICTGPFKENTRYTFLLYVMRVNSTSRNVNMSVRYTDGTTANLQRATPPDANTPSYTSFVSAANKTVQWVYIINHGGTTSLYYDQCGIFEGVYALADFVPYVGITSQIPMQGNVLRSLPDSTKDELHLTYLRPSEREGWAWYSREVVQAVYEATLDESGVWNRNNGTNISDGTWRFETSLTARNLPASAWSSANYAVPAYCDHLAAMGTGGLYSSGADHFGIYQHRFYVRISGITTVDELKAWLAANPLTVLYPVAPTTTTLDPIELPQLPAPNVTVWCDGGSAQPTFMLEYIQNANIVISRLEDSIADLATS